MKKQRRAIVIVALLGALVLPAVLLLADESQSAQDQKLVAEGARLWPVYCAQCHNARPGSQFSPSQWEAITMHMRTQSIMPAKDMRAIKEFLEHAR